MSQELEHMRSVGIVLARRKVDNPWIDHAWTPHAVFWPAPQTEANTVLADDEALRLVYGSRCAAIRLAAYRSWCA